MIYFNKVFYDEKNVSVFVVLIAVLTAAAAGTGQSDPEIVKSKGAERNYTGIFLLISKKLP